MSASILDILAFQPSELPPDYEPVAPPQFLVTMGMARNPDFIYNLTELETVGRRGGSAPFLATYGRDAHIRLLLNGVYFRYDEHASEFLRMQQEQKRCLAAYRRSLGDGTWILLYALDPDAVYEDTERQALESAIVRHASRIEAEPVYSTLWTNYAL
jgi:hypothetical protein